MSRRFKINKLDRKVGCWVELDNPYDSTDLGHYYYMTEEAMLEIDNWVRQHNLGTRKSFAMWHLKNEAALSLFLLKWG
jgi:hypothetical protein